MVYRDYKKLFFCIIVLFSVPICFSFGETYGIDSPEIRSLRYVYRKAGKVFPVHAYPVHGSDVLELAEQLPSFSEEQDQRLVDDLIESLRKQKEKDIAVTGNVGVAYEHRLYTNTLLADEGEVKNGIDFQRSYLSFAPFLHVGGGIGAFTGPYLEAEAAFRPAWTRNYEPMNNFVLPTTGSEIDMSFDFLSKGMFSWNGKYVDIFFGRDALHFAPSPGATLYPSKQLPYLDALRLSVPIGHFTMDYLLATIQPRKGPIDVPISDEHFGFMFDPAPTSIVTTVHRFQWNWGPVKAGIGEQVVLARSNNMFLITDILPISIWHNADIRPNNLSFILDLSWAFYPGFTLSGMLGFDDINAEIVGLSDSSVPTIPAWIVQLEYGLLTRQFFADFLCEVGYTHYLWGNYGYDGERDPDSWGGVYLARAIYRYSPNNEAILLPLTSPYGPGVYWGRLLAAFQFPGLNLKISADFLVVSKLKKANLVTTEYQRDDDLEHGERIWYFSLDVPCVYTWKQVAVKVAPGVLIRDAQVAFECTLGLQYKLQGNTHFKIPGR